MSLSSSEECKFEPNNSFYEEFKLHNQIYHLKEELLPYNIKEPIFFNYYKLLKMENLLNFEDNKDNNIPFQLGEERKELMKIDRAQDQEEQINEIKVNLFFILKLECEYNNEYAKMISNNNFKAKRLVIQDYKITNNTIQFGEKSYSFIPLIENVFKFEGNKIELLNKNKKSKKIDDIQMILNGNNIMNEKEFQNHNNITNLKEEEKLYNNYKKKKVMVKKTKVI